MLLYVFKNNLISDNSIVIDVIFSMYRILFLLVSCMENVLYDFFNNNVSNEVSTDRSGNIFQFLKARVSWNRGGNCLEEISAKIIHFNEIRRLFSQFFFSYLQKKKKLRNMKAVQTDKAKYTRINLKKHP